MRENRPQLLDVLFDDAVAAENGPLHNVQQRATALLKLNRAVKGLPFTITAVVPCRKLSTECFSARDSECQLVDALTLRTTCVAIRTTSANSTIIVFNRHQD